MTVLLVISNCPDRDCAERIANTLIERRLAACVSILGPATSVYRWQGKVESATEVPLLIKTGAHRYGEVEAAIRELHPYELPEIVAVGVDKGLQGYLQWVLNESASPAG